MPERLSSAELIRRVLDPGTFESWDAPVVREGSETPDDAYAAQLARAAQKAGTDESVVTGRALLDGLPVAVVVGEFDFLAGSVGRATARRIRAAVERATAEGLPVLAAPVSGGTRMQEGVPAFVQMAPVAAAIAAHRAAGLAYLVWLRHPTTGGVMASWGSLGQMTAVEPDALVGFLGPRVFEALHGEPFPEGVQTGENLAAHGVVDAVLPVARLRERAAAVVRLLTDRVVHVGAAGDARAEQSSPPAPPTPPADASGTWSVVRRSRAEDHPGVRDLLAVGAEGTVVLSGTGEGERDPGVLLALTRLGGHSCVLVGHDRASVAAHGPFGPAGLRTARRGMRLAAELGLPLVTVVDTGGAELSVAAEQGAMAGEIARCLAELTSLPVPTVSVLLGQGNGGGALALLPADHVIASGTGWLSPLPPEGASAIVHRDTSHAAEMAHAHGVTAAAMATHGLVDQVLEGEGRELVVRLAGGVAAALSDLGGTDDAARRAARLHRYA
ncbi:acetyl-CoA carboxyl transferase [Nocardioidaceae bacterium]|nr:acetyl-CoA carboxyl transferase [Nocardioidaceae bacterium]